MTDPQQGWQDRIVGALGAVLAVAVVIGCVIGAVTYAAARMTGLTGGGDPASASAQPAAPSTSAAPSPTATSSPSASRRPSPTSRPTEHKTHHASHHKATSGSLTLSASPGHVGEMGRIDLAGRYPGHNGTTLVVERREGGHWTRFPVSATVRGGRFHTWVASGQSGPNHFRVVDGGSGRASDAVTVVVG